MVKFLQVDTANNGNLLIPVNGIVFIEAYLASQIRIKYDGQYASNDIFGINHTADVDADGKIGSMVDVLRKLVIDAAQGRWSDPVVNITSLLPKTITNITLS